MEQKKISKATQVELIDSTTLLGIISPILPLKYLGLIVVVTHKKREKKGQTSAVKFNLFCCENDKHLLKLSLYSQHRLGMKTSWT